MEAVSWLLEAEGLGWEDGVLWRGQGREGLAEGTRPGVSGPLGAFPSVRVVGGFGRG